MQAPFAPLYYSCTRVVFTVQKGSPKGSHASHP
jgi:hypothetical protein